MSALSMCDSAFGPRVNERCRAFDFTLQFEDLFLVLLPNSLFLLQLLVSLIQLIKKDTIIKRSSTSSYKLAVFSLLIIFQTVSLALRLKSKTLRTPASLPGSIIALVAAVGALLLSWLQHHRSEQPSTLLALFLAVVSIVDVARVRTLWLIPHSSALAVIQTVVFVLNVSALYLESKNKRANLRRPEKFASSGPEPFTGFWNIVAFSWVLGTLKNGYSHVLSVDDLPALDYRLSSDRLHQQLANRCAQSDMSKKYAFLIATFRAYAIALVSGVLPRLLLSAFRFAQPFLINDIVSFIGNKKESDDIGKGIIGAYALVYGGRAASMALSEYYTNRFVIRLRGGLISLIYQQTIQARSVDLGEIDGVTLMGTDVERIVGSFRSIHELWGSFLDIAVAIYLLERQVGLACLIPGLTALFFVALTFWLSGLAKRFQRTWIEKVEQRIKTTTSSLANMRAVKMLGLGSRIFDIITGLRSAEVQESKKFRKVLLAEVFFSNAPQSFAPAFTLILYAVIANARNDASFFAAKAFTSLSLISLLTSPVLTLVQAIPDFIQCLSSFDRIQEFYRKPKHPLSATNDDLQSTDVERTSIEMQLLGARRARFEKPVVAFYDQDFAWNETGTATLKDVNFSIAANRLTAIIGPTGSGKTTLLDSILGETISLRGRAERNFVEAAYCSQIPWLINGTVKSNITCSTDEEIDERWYQKVLWACGLEEDMDTLRQGDQTLVGSDGTKLSGGQKQRVSLARAVFSKRKLLLLDDVFSGVDNTNVALICERLLGPLGLLRANETTVVLATHSRPVLLIADEAFSLENGRVTAARAIRSLEDPNSIVSTFAPGQGNEVDGSGHGIVASGQARIDTAEETLSMLNEEAVDLKRQRGTPSVYRYYCQASGWKNVAYLLICGALFTTADNFSVIWVNFWSSANEKSESGSVNGMYLGVYAALGFLSPMMLLMGTWFLFMTIITNSAIKLHTDLLTAVIKAPLRFFQENDTGNITNRFSQDMELIGMELPLVAVNYIVAAFNCAGMAVVLAVFGRYLTASMPFLVVAIYFIQRAYLRTSRQVRLLDIESKAPVYLQFVETKNGASTIRAFGWHQSFQKKLQSLLDRSQRPVYLLLCIQQWLALVLDILVTTLAVILVAIVVTWRDKFTPGQVGVSLVTVMSFSRSLAHLIRSWTSLETSIGAVSRIKQFRDNTVPEEEELGIFQPQEPPPCWPSAGLIQFENVMASYKEGSSSVLKGISLSIKPGQKTAICGSSGSGKTSLILSLLHMIRIEGSITIDNVDISNMIPDHLRACINIVPQEPFLMPGTVRLNVDPFGDASDESIIAALRRLGLWERIEHSGGLDGEMPLTTWSVGERQLICMAKAMVRKSPVLLLDEATSSVDHEAEEIMQQVIETEFAEQTVLSVVHRLRYIERYDKVAVMQKGNVAEFDCPEVLLSKPSILASMKRAGESASSPNSDGDEE